MIVIYLGLAVFAAGAFLLVYHSLERSVMDRITRPDSLGTGEVWARVVALPLRMAGRRTKANLEFLGWSARSYLTLFLTLAGVGWGVAAVMASMFGAGSVGVYVGAGGGAAFAVLMGPAMVAGSVSGRRRRVRAAFPDWLSMLYLRLSMGHTPKEVIHDSIEYADPPLGREVARLDSDLAASIDFRGALQKFASRLGVDEAQDVASYLQAGWADKLPAEALADMGTMLLEIAREQAESAAIKAKLTGTVLGAFALLVAFMPFLYPAAVSVLGQIASFKI